MSRIKRELNIKEDRVLHLVTDGAAYMVKCAREVLTALMPNMVHTLCICHGLNRVAEEVRACFPEVDLLISNIKKVFTKAPSRIRQYKEMLPSLALPPQPVLTRWSSWINAASFYADNFIQIKEVVETFDSEDAACIRKSKELFKNGDISRHLAYIKSNYSIISKSINELEGHGLTLARVFDILAEIKESLSLARGDVGLIVQNKLNSMLQKNPGISRLIEVAKVLAGERSDLGMPPDMIAALKYAPMTSCDVERTFSIYKNILTDRRSNFIESNLEMYIICNCERRE